MDSYRKKDDDTTHSIEDYEEDGIAAEEEEDGIAAEEEEDGIAAEQDRIAAEKDGVVARRMEPPKSKSKSDFDSAHITRRVVTLLSVLSSIPETGRGKTRRGERDTSGHELYTDSDRDIFDEEEEDTEEAPPPSSLISHTSSVSGEPIKRKRFMQRSPGLASPPPFKRQRRTQTASDTSMMAAKGFAERAKALVKTKKKLPVGAIGRLLCQHDIGADYNTFASNTLRGIRLDVEEGKSVARMLATVPEPSDSIVRQLLSIVEQQQSTIMGLTTVLDSCLAGMQQLEQQQADCTVTKSKELTLPEPTFLAYDNVTQVWRVPQLDVSEMED
ncbi:unnamed protein product, partial [Heligmosomoides polygyrus]|uniref:BLOC-1-related complex subunit 5 n=1 Tax=Heligmosomoides polygyrus TaxID=6339 RepID=A0A183FAZ2_HELPZ